MTQTKRQKWLGTLEIIAIRRPDDAEAEWAWVMKELELGPEYFLAVYEAVRQGRWREAENPGGYLKAVAKREKNREEPSGSKRGPRGIRGIGRLDYDAEEVTVGGGEIDGETFTAEEMLDSLEYGHGSGMPVRDRDGTWRTGGGPEVDYEALFRSAPGGGDEWRRQKLSEMKPGPLARYAKQIDQMRAAEGKDERDEPYMDPTPERLPDWNTLAQEAGLSEWEKKVVEYKARGMGWREAVAEQKDGASKRAIRAAWKKLERSGEKKLWEAAKAQKQNLTADDTDDTDFR